MSEKPSEAWARAGWQVVNGELVRIDDERATDIRSGSEKGGSVDIHANDSGAAPKLERNIGDGALGKVEVQESASGQFLVRVTSVRKRLLDYDNLCEKYVCDLLRYAGVIPGDSPATTRIEVCQQKADKGAAEEIKVEVFRL